MGRGSIETTLQEIASVAAFIDGSVVYFLPVFYYYYDYGRPSKSFNCDTQEEIDYYWEKLSAVPEAEQCGWLKDKYGLSWQIVPTALPKMLQDKDAREVAGVTEAFLKMKKFDIAALKRAYEGKE